MRLQGLHKLAAYTDGQTNWELEFVYKVSYADEPLALVMGLWTAMAAGEGRASVI